MLKQDIVQQLGQIKYPGFSKDIISFGMLKDIKISPELINLIFTQPTNDQNISLCSFNVIFETVFTHL